MCGHVRGPEITRARHRRKPHGHRAQGRARQGCRHLRRPAHLRGRVAPLRRGPRARSREPRCRARRGGLPARSLRLRQDHAAQDRRWRRAPLRWPRAHRQPGGRRAEPLRAAGEARRGPDVPGLRAVPASLDHRQRGLRPEVAHKERGQGRSPSPRSSASALAITRPNTRISSRAASSSAWRLPAPSRRARACF